MMRLLDFPIPPKPDYFGPDGAPPGIAVDFTALKSADGYPWYLSRPKITPRVAIVHTNAANHEGSLQSSINWGNAAANNTKPHYHFNAPQPTKVVPTDRRGIANATPGWYEDQTGEVDCSYWTISMETADSGMLDDPAVSDFLYDHAELVARALAYESIVWDFPLIVPDVWNGTGIATHTWPFPYPAYTTARGKTCPGDKKKATFRDQIVPRAQQIKAAWLATVPLEEVVFAFVNEQRLIDTRPLGDPTVDGQVIKVKVPIVGDVRGASVTVTAVESASAGFISIWDGVGERPNTSKLNFGDAAAVANTTQTRVASDGTFKMFVRGRTHVIVDLIGVYTSV